MLRFYRLPLALLLLFFLAACRPTPGKPPLPTTVGQAATAMPVTPPLLIQTETNENTAAPAPPTLSDLWEGQAHFVVDVAETGLPMGESDTLITADGQFWSYVHASERSAGAVDQCGAPVAFPGCVVIYRSEDGITFQHDAPPICRIACNQCPCTAEDDHIVQQQYPRVLEDVGRYWMLYEGVRGPGAGEPGDTQFGLGLARSMTAEIDGPWGKYPGNPILVDLPGNIGLGHADLVEVAG